MLNTPLSATGISPRLPCASMRRMSLPRLGRRAPLPEHVRIALAPLFDGGVEGVQVIEHSLFARLHGRAIATTRRRKIYLRGSAADFFEDPVLMLHEYCHVLKQWEPRTMTIARYI